jgi:hypothetical protein
MLSKLVVSREGHPEELGGLVLRGNNETNTSDTRGGVSRGGWLPQTGWDAEGHGLALVHVERDPRRRRKLSTRLDQSLPISLHVTHGQLDIICKGVRRNL